MTPEPGKIYAARMRLAGAQIAIQEGDDDPLDPLTAEDLEVLTAVGVDVAAELASAKRGAP